MSNNIFKTERKQNNRNIERNYLSNSFKSKNEPVIQKFEITEGDFPELSAEEKKEEPIKEDNKLQYKNAILKQDTKREENEVLKPGWVKIFVNENNKIVMEGYNESSEPSEDYNTIAQNVIKALVEKWETERILYNNLYGEGEYERIYYMPKKNDYNYDDEEDDAEDEETTVRDDNDENYEDSYYYD